MLLLIYACIYIRWVSALYFMSIKHTLPTQSEREKKEKLVHARHQFKNSNNSTIQIFILTTRGQLPSSSGPPSEEGGEGNHTPGWQAERLSRKNTTSGFTCWDILKLETQRNILITPECLQTLSICVSQNSTAEHTTRYTNWTCGI